MVDLVRGFDEVQIDTGGSRAIEEITDEDGTEITFETDVGELDPVLVSSYAMDAIGNSDQLTSDCGTTETRRNGSLGWQLTFEGIITLQQVRRADEIGLGSGVLVTINFPPWVRDYTVDTFSIDKPNDLNQWYDPTNHPNGTEAFEFQLQTKGDETTNT